MFRDGFEGMLPQTLGLNSNLLADMLHLYEIWPMDFSGEQCETVSFLVVNR